MNFIIQGILFIIVFGSVLFLSYVTTKYIAAKSIRTLKGRYINIVETVSIGLDRKLHLVKVGEQFLLIASCGKSVELLTSVKLDQYTDGENGENVQGLDFRGFFNKYMRFYKKRNEIKEEEVKNITEEKQENRIKTNLEKIKQINQKLSGWVKGDGNAHTKEEK